MNSKDIAEEAFKRLIKRFDDLSGTSHAASSRCPGKTLFRLRLGAADKAAAAALCGRLRVARRELLRGALIRCSRRSLASPGRR